MTALPGIRPESFRLRANLACITYQAATRISLHPEQGMSWPSLHSVIWELDRARSMTGPITLASILACSLSIKALAVCPFAWMTGVSAWWCATSRGTRSPSWGSKLSPQTIWICLARGWKRLALPLPRHQNRCAMNGLLTG